LHEINYSSYKYLGLAFVLLKFNLLVKTLQRFFQQLALNKQRLMKKCKKTKKRIPKEKELRTPAQRARINLDIGERH